MKLALVTTPPSQESGIGDYTRELTAELARHADIDVFVEHGREGEELLGRVTRSARSLERRHYDQVVYQLGNEIAHAFMEPLLRRIGGTVVLHDWVLFDMALAAHPALARGGLKGLALAWREGGTAQASIWADNFLARRRELKRAKPALDPGAEQGGWHAPEPGGRWTSDAARIRLPGRALESVRVACTTEPGRSVVISCDGRSAATAATKERRELELELDLRGAAEPTLEIAAAPLFVSEEQRRNGDTRRLGAFVRRITVRDARGEREIDLREPSSTPAFTLTRDRFRLSFNRSVVRFADAFLVHSEFVRAKIRAARRVPAPIAVVPHGARARWSDEDRGDVRARLGLPPDWRSAVLLTSFGHVQAHKRIEPLLHAFAAARAARSDLRLALIGAEDREALDAPALVRRLGLESCVRLTGRVRESEAWPWIHAGDFAVQLRGPSTGGSSGGVFQSLGLGRAVIASDMDEQRELPGSCVLRVAHGPREVEELARLFLELASDPARRASLEQAARVFVETECSWSRVAQLYAENLAVFAQARGSARTR